MSRWVMHMAMVPINGDTPFRGICGFPRYSKKKKNLTEDIAKVTCSGCLTLLKEKP